MQSGTAFRVTATCGAARAGVWGSMLTPVMLLQTRHGQLPHMMREMLDTLPLTPTAGVAVRFPQLFGHDSTVAGSGKHLAQYSHVGERMTVVTLREPGRFPAALGSDKGLSIDTFAGKRKAVLADYTSALLRLRPFAAVSFSEEVSYAHAGTNKSRGSVDRSIKWFSEMAAALAAASAAGAPVPGLLAYTPCMPDAGPRAAVLTRLLAAIEPFTAAGTGGEAPLVVGFALGGLHGGESPSERAAALADVLPRLPPTGVRVLPGGGSPLEVLAAVAAGVDVFDTDYPGILTQFAAAASFQYAYLGANVVAAAPAGGTASVAASATERTQPAPGPAGNVVPPPTDSGDDSKMNLRDSRYEADARPLVPGCGCFACAGYTATPAHFVQTAPGREFVHRGHSRAYVHHLLNTHEMLADVLLQVHNVYHYAAFFGAVRDAVTGGYLDDYTAWFRAANRLG
jgi:queuine tRNA-ribosyltransferase subunit QTRTD1